MSSFTRKYYAEVFRGIDGRWEAWTVSPHTGDKKDPISCGDTKRECLAAVRRYNRAIAKAEGRS